MLFAVIFYGGKALYFRAPLISWGTTCKPKALGGLGLKNITAWNKACVAKLIWIIAEKKRQALGQMDPRMLFKTPRLVDISTVTRLQLVLAQAQPD